MALTKINNNTLSAITGLPAGVGGSMVKISSQDFSSATSLAFTSIPNTYSTILFYLTNIQVGTNSSHIRFISSINNGSSYGVNTTSVYGRRFNASNGGDLNGGGQSATYSADGSTGDIVLYEELGSASPKRLSGMFYGFNFNSTSGMKSFHSRLTGDIQISTNYGNTAYSNGIINTTSAVDAIKFSPHQGNFSGNITLYGVTA